MLDIVYWKQIHLAFWKMSKKKTREEKLVVAAADIIQQYIYIYT